MKKDDTVYLEHILLAMERIREYLATTDHDAFLQDHLHQDGFIHQVQIIGEASRLVSEETKRLAPDIPWKDIIGMRNRLVHGYFLVNLEAVWDTVTRDVPAAEPAIRKLLETLKEQW
jgi:uncharacterized protein with HEPN domain